MSGHSKWATTHRQKEIKDAARGKVFSKMARLITIAAKTGGSTDPASNFKLREMIEKARAANMPKDNIDRAVSKASGAHNLEEVMYEGFGPAGIGVLINAATDNRNRTAQEIKNLLERSGGSLAGPGAVSFQFESKGYLSIEKSDDPDAQSLQLIDLGVDDIDVGEDAIICFVPPEQLYQKRKQIEDAGFKIIESQLIMKAKIPTHATDASQAEKVEKFLEDLEDHDDVSEVFTTYE